MVCTQVKGKQALVLRPGYGVTLYGLVVQLNSPSLNLGVTYSLSVVGVHTLEIQNLRNVVELGCLVHTSHNVLVV